MAPSRPTKPCIERIRSRELHYQYKDAPALNQRGAVPGLDVLKAVGRYQFVLDQLVDSPVGTVPSTQAFLGRGIGRDGGAGGHPPGRLGACWLRRGRRNGGRFRRRLRREVNEIALVL